jgi:hypothetical protein
MKDSADRCSQEISKSSPPSGKRRRRLALNFGITAVFVTLVFLLIYPAFVGCPRQPITRTTVMMNNLAVALKLYYNEYGDFPNRSVNRYSKDHLLTTKENECLYRLFGGQDVDLAGASDTTNANPRKIAFLFFKPNDVGLVDEAYEPCRHGGMTNIVSRWGTAFRIVLDYDGDSQVVPWPGANPVKGEIAVWCVHPFYKGPPLLHFLETPTIVTNCSWQ